MHELSLAVEIVRLLESHGRELQRITRLTLGIGTLSCVDEQALRVALEAAMVGTLAEGANIVVEMIEAQALCLDCGQIFQPPDRIEPCPHCGAFNKRWLKGEDFTLRSVEGIPA